MSQLTKNMLIQMLQLQDKVNSKIDPVWKLTKNPFHRAIYMEAAEAIEHHGWKWWKKQTPNMPAVHMELVDIWHFILSEIMLGHDTDTSCQEIAHIVSSSGFLEPDLSDTNTVRLLENLMAAALARRLSGMLINFSTLLTVTGFSWRELYKWYIGKNVLNTFRQDNGYKEGTYVKIWKDGREDNDHLTDILNDISSVNEHTFYDDVYRLVQQAYIDSTD